MKVLVVGSQGMAGHAIVRHLKAQGYDVTTCARQIGVADLQLDISNTVRTEDFFRVNSVNYSYIINCVGMLVQSCIDRPDFATIVNGWFPNLLADCTKHIHTRVIHISTDCVFDGTKGNYTETDIPSERNAYGRTKAMGELFNDKDITMRTSIIGEELKSDGVGLLNWFLHNSTQVVQGWENAIWTGVTTDQLAKCIDIWMQDPSVTGLYHVVNDSSITKYDLLKVINDVYQTGKIIERVSGPKDIDKSLLDTRKAIEFDIPDYRTMVENMREFHAKI